MKGNQLENKSSQHLVLKWFEQGTRYRPAASVGLVLSRGLWLTAQIPSGNACNYKQRTRTCENRVKGQN